MSKQEAARKGGGITEEGGAESSPSSIGPNKETVECRNCGEVIVDYICRKRKFGTDCFSKEDIEYLVSQFEQTGIESRGDVNSRLHIYRTDEVGKFLKELNQIPGSFSREMGVI